MNISALKELIAIAQEETPSWKQFEGKYVIVRGYYSGVWAGKLLSGKVGDILLEDGRMLHRWSCNKGVGCGGIAAHGLDLEKSKLCATQKKVAILDKEVSQFFICTNEVEEQIRNAQTFKK